MADDTTKYATNRKAGTVGGGRSAALEIRDGNRMASFDLQSANTETALCVVWN